MTVLEQRRKRYERIAASTVAQERTQAFYAAADSLADDVDPSVHGWLGALLEHTSESVANPENTALDDLDDSASDPALIGDHLYLTTATTAAWAFAGASLQALPPGGEGAARQAVTVLLRQLAALGTGAGPRVLPVEHATTADCVPGRVARQLVEAGARGLPAGATRADAGHAIASWLPIGYHKATAAQLAEAQLPVWILTFVAEGFANLAESAPQRHLPGIAMAIEQTAEHLAVRDPAADHRLHSDTSRIYRACGQTMLAQEPSQRRGRLRKMFGG